MKVRGAQQQYIWIYMWQTLCIYTHRSRSTASKQLNGKAIDYRQSRRVAILDCVDRHQNKNHTHTHLKPLVSEHLEYESRDFSCEKQCKTQNGQKYAASITRQAIQLLKPCRDSTVQFVHIQTRHTYTCIYKD